MPALRQTVPIGQLVYAIGEVETGHIKPVARRYTTVNSIGATGRYQVMKGNIAAWTKEALGRTLTLSQWLKSPDLQDKVAAYKLGKSQQKYGSWQSAAAVWFSGQPDPNKTTSDGHFTVRQYVDAVGKHLGKGSVSSGGGAVPKGVTPSTPDSVDGILGALSAVTNPLVDIGKGLLSVGKFAEFLLKLALPSTWVRVVCGVLGAVFLLMGLVVLGHEARGT